MDAVLLLIGIGLLVIGAKKRDDAGHRTGGGIAALVIGTVVTSIGAAIFTITFIVAFFVAYYRG